MISSDRLTTFHPNLLGLPVISASGLSSRRIPVSGTTDDQFGKQPFRTGCHFRTIAVEVNDGLPTCSLCLTRSADAGSDRQGAELRRRYGSERRTCRRTRRDKGSFRGISLR